MQEEQAQYLAVKQNRVETAAVLAKAVLRVAQRLDIPQRALGEILGLSEASVSRLAARRRTLKGSSKEGELAVLLVRLWRSLDALVGGDAEKARAWFKAYNQHVAGVPAERVRSIQGLVDVVEYLDAIRGRL